GIDALQQLAHVAIDLVVSDLVMPGVDGVALLKEVRRLYPYIPFVLVTGHGTVGSAVSAMKEGANDYLLKPLNREELLLVVERHIDLASLRINHDRMRDLLNDKFSFQNIITTSALMGRVLAKAQQVVAAPRTTVAIYGESGVGKEVLARGIHTASGCSPATFIAINCAAIPETLLESELFGHVKGAFTGADHEREGKCSRARGGTLFLDEIGDMSLPLQAKLLRLVEERTYEKIGSDTPLTADFRVIVATHHNLDENSQQGAFRRDLYYRLNVFPITIPPLRERRDDIPQLVEHFLGVFRQFLGKRLPGLSRSALEHLCLCDWPGNIRELRNRLEYAAIVTNGELIQVEHLSVAPTSAATPVALDNRISIAFDFTPEEFSADAVNQRLLDWAMSKSNNNKSAAARLLKTTRKLFY
ncbi:MAG: sigma-54 dependent transcriptional regulator, partial [Desulfuromonadales bacterium]